MGTSVYIDVLQEKRFVECLFDVAQKWPLSSDFKLRIFFTCKIQTKGSD